MDIKGWPLDKIMQLPDNFFGRRFPYIFHITQIYQGSLWYIHQTALPDVCVLWELWVWSCYYASIYEELAIGFGNIKLSLGDVLPANVTEFNALEPLPLNTYLATGVIASNMYLTRLKLPVRAQGRRLVLQITESQEYPARMNVGLVFSSLPNEVPECFLSH